MSKHHPDLLAEIEAFIKVAKISEITFGRHALSDPHFVRDLRNNRRLWPETVKKVRDHIAANTPSKRKKAA